MSTLSQCIGDTDIIARSRVTTATRGCSCSAQMFVALGPGSFLAFNDVMCALAAVVFASLWYVGSRTPRHIGVYIRTTGRLAIRLT